MTANQAEFWRIRAYSANSRVREDAGRISLVQRGRREESNLDAARTSACATLSYGRFRLPECRDSSRPNCGGTWRISRALLRALGQRVKSRVAVEARDICRCRAEV